MPKKISLEADKAAAQNSIEMAAIEAEAFDDTAAMDDISPDEALACSSVGPYKTQQQLKQLLDKLEQDIKQTEFRTETETRTSYLIVSDKYGTSQAAEAGMKEMKAAGVKDIAMMKKDSKNRIALGVYRHKKSAIKRVDDLKMKGYDVQMKPRHKETPVFWADILYRPASSDTIAMFVPDTHKKKCDESIKLSLLNSE